MTPARPAVYRDTPFGGCLGVAVERRADGTTVLRSTEPLAPHRPRLTDSLAHWARVAPDRPFVAQRDRAVAGGGAWVEVSYAAMLDRARRIGQALVERGLSAERPVAILSDNDVEHLTLAFGAMWAGIPWVPISPAYSLQSRDHAKLKFIVGRVTPGLVFAADAAYGRALDALAALDPSLEVAMPDAAARARRAEGHAVTSFEALLDAAPDARLDAAHAAITPSTIVKFLFTSGSTKAPKGVVNTHAMLTANQQMLRQAFPFVADEPPVLVDWLPWNHTFGGNHNVGLVLVNGGTLYLDEGKPTDAGIATTLRNLREIAPTVYFNVPKGFEAIAAAMAGDDTLRRSLFSRVRMFMFAGAGLSQAVWDELDRLGERTIGARVPVVTGLGMTEASPSCTFALRVGDVASGHIGLPCPGVEAKLVPEGDGGEWAKTEVRFRGPNLMPGYWREPQLSAEAFDDEGYYRTGDAVRWVDAADPSRGLRFDGRLAEDFKLDSGTFVSVGPLRAKVVALGAPLVQDAVVTGLNRSEVGLLVVPRLDACRALAGVAPDADVDTPTLLRAPAVRAHFQALVDRLWAEGTGGASRVARAVVLAEPPSIDHGEVTDKGSINQRAVLDHRAALVDALHDGRADGLILPRR